MNDIGQSILGKSRHRSWCFTLNNWTNADCLSLNTLACSYLIYGKEVSPTTATPHLQGMSHLTPPKLCVVLEPLSLDLILLLPEETAAQNKEYCSKGGDFFELGVCPASPADGGSAEATRWDAAWSHAVTGNVEAICADIRIRCYSTIQKIRTDYMPAVPSVGAHLWHMDLWVVWVR